MCEPEVEEVESPEGAGEGVADVFGPAVVEAVGLLDAVMDICGLGCGAEGLVVVEVSLFEGGGEHLGDASLWVGDFAAGSAGVGVLGQPKELRRFAEFCDVAVGPWGGAGDVGYGAAEADVGSCGEHGGAVGALV